MSARLFVDPGALRCRLTLQSLVPVPDGIGGFAAAWSTVAAVFALVEPVAAASRFGAGQELETVTHRITLRRREGVEPGMRFIDGGGRIFGIVTVHDPDEGGRYLACRTRETPA